MNSIFPGIISIAWRTQRMLLARLAKKSRLKLKHDEQ